MVAGVLGAEGYGHRCLVGVCALAWRPYDLCRATANHCGVLRRDVEADSIEGLVIEILIGVVAFVGNHQGGEGASGGLHQHQGGCGLDLRGVKVCLGCGLEVIRVLLQIENAARVVGLKRGNDVPVVGRKRGGRASGSAEDAALVEGCAVRAGEDGDMMGSVGVVCRGPIGKIQAAVDYPQTGRSAHVDGHLGAACAGDVGADGIRV